MHLEISKIIYNLKRREYSVPGIVYHVKFTSNWPAAAVAISMGMAGSGSEGTQQGAGTGFHEVKIQRAPRTTNHWLNCNCSEMLDRYIVKRGVENERNFKRGEMERQPAK
jgi:hypothetical protein